MSQPTFLNRQALYLRPDPGRVIVRPFKPAIEPRDLRPEEKTRANRIVDRVLSLDAETAADQLAEVLESFEGRHRNLLATFESRADEMEEALAAHPYFTQLQRRLVGAYFLHEYSFEAAALFNPSIVPHPDQTGVSEGSLRFVLSLRAVGRPHARTAGAPGSIRTRGLCPERRLHLRRAAARRGDRAALRRFRHLLELRDDPDRPAHAQPDGVVVAGTTGRRGPTTSKPSAPMLAAFRVFHDRPSDLPGIGSLRPGSRRSMSPDFPKIML